MKSPAFHWIDGLSYSQSVLSTGNQELFQVSVCGWCNGTGAGVCSRCNGYGGGQYSDRTWWQCGYCSGKGTVACSNCRGLGVV